VDNDSLLLFDYFSSVDSDIREKRLKLFAKILLRFKKQHILDEYVKWR